MAVGDNTKYGRVLAEWTVPEYVKYPHSKVWYVMVIGLALALLTHAIVVANFLFIIIIIIVSTIVYLHERNSPTMIEFLILEGGIALGERFYPYKEINSFWIIYEPPHVKLLYFGVNHFFRKELPIHLENQNPLVIRRILLDYLDEDLDQEDEAAEEGLARLFRL